MKSQTIFSQSSRGNKLGNIELKDEISGDVIDSIATEKELISVIDEVKSTIKYQQFLWDMIKEYSK